MQGGAISPAFYSFSHLDSVAFCRHIIKSSIHSVFVFSPWKPKEPYVCGPLSQMPQIFPVEIKGSEQGWTTGLSGEKDATWGRLRDLSSLEYFRSTSEVLSVWLDYYKGQIKSET